MDKINVRKIFCLLLCLSIIMSFSLTCFAQNDKTEVRFGYFDLSDYYHVNDDGTIDSFDTAYLDAVQEYTDLHFTYVNCGNWDRALEMLENHEIDIIGTMQWTQQREDIYEICDTSYGYTVAELAAKKDSGYIYEDYEGINNKTVGYIKGYVIADQLSNLMNEKGLTFNIKTYSTQTELENAFDNGEIDLIAANAHAIKQDWVLIEKFHYAPMYFASWKGNNAITEQISEALIKIKLYEPDFDEKTVKQYFSTMANSPFNKEEIDCINKDKTYTVYFDSATRPVAWLDDKTQAMTGILVDVCLELEKTTNLKFEFKPYSQYSFGDEENSVTYIVIDTDSSNENTDANTTEPIGEFSFSLYHKTGNDYDSNESYSIAYVKNRSDIRKYLMERYPNCTLTEYDNPQECLKDVNKNKCDLAFINTSIAENIIITNNMNNISSLPTTDKDFGIGLVFSGDDAHILAGIINKGIRLTDNNIVNKSMLKYALETTPKTDILYYLQNHPVLFLIITIGLIAVIAVMITLFLYARIMKKDKLRTEAISKERSDFFSRMSHDMRTPMNGILGLTNLSKDEYDVESLKDTIQKIDESGQYLLGLINDSLDYQKIESGSMELVKEIVSTEDLISSTVQMVRISAQEKNVSFSVVNKNADLNGYIRTDPMKVKQLFANLISNAVKFTPSGGSVELCIEVIYRGEGFVKDRISVSDSGVGMSEDFIQNKLYKPFAQERNTVTSQYEGTGLGLSIVKQIADLMGADISVESHIGEGTKFTVDISFETVSKKKAEEYLKQNNHSNADKLEILKNRTILLAEDHPLNAEIAERLLNKEGCTVIWAKDGNECMDIFTGSKSGDIDAILMDIRMPVMDGLEAAYAIRALDRNDAKTIPIIAMSANAYAQDIQKSLDAGMNDHLAKPIQPEKLYAALAEELFKVKQ